MNACRACCTKWPTTAWRRRRRQVRPPSTALHLCQYQRLLLGCCCSSPPPVPVGCFEPLLLLPQACAAAAALPPLSPSQAAGLPCIPLSALQVPELAIYVSLAEAFSLLLEETASVTGAQGARRTCHQPEPHSPTAAQPCRAGFGAPHMRRNVHALRPCCAAPAGGVLPEPQHARRRQATACRRDGPAAPPARSAASGDGL